MHIESHGFAIGRWWFPPFSVGRGECLALRLPAGTHAVEKQIMACLTRLEPVPGLTVPPRVEIARAAFGPRGWRRWLSDPTPLDWLRKQTNLSDAAIHAFLREFEIDSRFPLSRLAGTPKTMLGLAAALAKQPNALVSQPLESIRAVGSASSGWWPHICPI